MFDCYKWRHLLNSDAFACLGLIYKALGDDKIMVSTDKDSFIINHFYVLYISMHEN